MPDLEATGALPPDDTPRDLQAELEAEFADHLALVARDEMLRGRSADEAQEKANERFGDVTQIERQCRWVHQGDAVMLRTVMIGGLAILSLALGFSMWSSWRVQADLRQQLSEMSTQIDALRNSQPVASTGVITGTAVLGERGKPVVGVEVQLLKAPPLAPGKQHDPTRDWVAERTAITDKQGRFDFEAVTAGTYVVTSPLVAGNADHTTFGRAYTQTVDLAPGSQVDLSLDVAARYGKVRLAISGVLPGPFQTSDQKIELGLHIEVFQNWEIQSDNAESVKLMRHAPRQDYPPSKWNSNFLHRVYYTPDEAFRLATRRSQAMPSRGWGGTMLDITALGETPGSTDESAAGANRFITIAPYPPDSADGRVDENWIEGEYCIQVRLLAFDNQGWGISLRDFDDNKATIKRGEPASRTQQFAVAHNTVTDLRILIPEEAEQWGKALSDLQASLKLDQTSSRSRGVGGIADFLRSRDRPKEVADWNSLFRRAFEVEVDGPNPLE